MPNWCANVGSVTLPEGASEEAKEIFKKLAENQHKDGWLSNALPCPPEMHLGLEGTIGAECVSLEWLKSHSKFDGDFGKFEEDPSGTPKLIPSEEYLQYLQNTFGAISWYDWRVRAWGTKWDVDAELTIGENSIEFVFDSAWAPPLAFFDWLGSKGLHYEIMYSEPGCCFGGSVSFDGSLKEEHLEDEDYLVFAIKEFGDPVDCMLDVQSYASYADFTEAHTLNHPRLKELVKEYYDCLN